ncbi:DUF4382 domain-containing protein [Alteromonas lipolytica]|uniref:DUF4382 domain-containing protein n=1 Tax=Alteromonas lipolytica TaxID=1856405 RepID=A0A1E8FDJ6_9ALTE|nr:DUF4382 domain-containing protein [Alteromonas lipolytica]OFI33991.1 hypothetical protein BFC17_20770 [Alteromonas lipolytica]GGF66498.1 lipoprotein [Alteromonas lipolytica]
MQHPLNERISATNTAFKIAAIAGLSASLFACGGGSSSNSTPTPTPSSSSFSLAISDAPVDEANAVVVYFNTVELIGPDGPITFDVRDENNDPQAIDLLNYQGEAFVTIVDATDIPSGTYTQLRLEVTDDSYIEMDSGTFDLKVPSNELKLDGIEALPGVEAAYTVEFDLRKSLVDPVGQPNTIFLKPRGVRLVANDSVGTLLGTVSPELITDTACSGKIDMDSGNAVYIYEGTSLDPDLLGDDADNPANTDEISPYTIANVNYNDDTQSYEFVAGYLPAGGYTVGFSCLALNDEPESDENADVFSFQAVVETDITATEQTTLTFE